MNSNDKYIDIRPTDRVSALPNGDFLGALRSNDPEQSLYACRSIDRSAGDHQNLYRDDGAFAKAVIYEESQVLANL